MTGDFRALSIITLWPTQTFHTEESKQVPLLQAAGRRPGVRASLPCRICEGAMLGFSGPWEVEWGWVKVSPFHFSQPEIKFSRIAQPLPASEMGAPLLHVLQNQRRVLIPSHTPTICLFFNHTHSRPNTVQFVSKIKKTNVYISVRSLLLFSGFPGPRVGLQAEKVFQILWFFSELNVLRWFACLLGFFVLFFKLS